MTGLVFASLGVARKEEFVEALSDGLYGSGNAKALRRDIARILHQSAEEEDAIAHDKYTIPLIFRRFRLCNLSCRSCKREWPAGRIMNLPPKEPARDAGRLQKSDCFPLVFWYNVVVWISSPNSNRAPPCATRVCLLKGVLEQ